MTLPGFVTGQPLNGSQVGQALFLFGPSLPHESPVPMPRVLARALFPQGFQPFRVAAPVAPPVMAPAPVQPLIPPAGIPAPNKVVTQPPVAAVPQPVQPQPAPGGYRPISSGGEPIAPARSQRIRIRERAGL